MTAERPRELGDEVARLRDELHDARHQLVAMEREARRLREELARLEGSAAGRLAVRLQQQARRVAPAGSRRQRGLHSIAQGTATLMDGGPRALVRQVRRDRRERRTLGGGDTPAHRQREYRTWLAQHTPTPKDLAAMRAQCPSWRSQPVISLIMPVRDPDREWLVAAIASVSAQTYPRWELCVADDGSAQPHVRALLEEESARDARVKVVFREASGGISAASNTALTLATGEYVGFVDHDDLLRPHALHMMVAHLQTHPDDDIIYSDEDKTLPTGVLGDPMFKPAFSPDLLLSWNYITHFVLMRRSLLAAIGGFRSDFDGSQDHDVLLRATERTDRVGHVSDVLYSWRMVRGSAALSADYKPLARDAGRRAVADALRRRNLEGRVEFGAHPGLYPVRYAISGSPSVDILIPTRDHLKLLRACIESIETRSTYPLYTITVIDNGSRSKDTLAYLRRLDHTVLTLDAPFNFARLINHAAAATNGEHLLLLNNDVRVITPDWIEAMLELSQRSDVGAVGARLLYPDGRVQHEGIVCGRLHLAANVEMRWPVVREASAVTGACLMTRRSVFEAVGGLDERFERAFNDVDYCLRVRDSGHRVLFTPFAELEHREGASRGIADIPESDRMAFIERWGDVDELDDPFLNVNVLWPNPLRLRLT